MKSKDFPVESKEFPEILLKIVAAYLIVEGLATREASVLAVHFVNAFL